MFSRWMSQLCTYMYHIFHCLRLYRRVTKNHTVTPPPPAPPFRADSTVIMGRKGKGDEWAKKETTCTHDTQIDRSGKVEWGKANPKHTPVWSGVIVIIKQARELLRKKTSETRLGFWGRLGTAGVQGQSPARGEGGKGGGGGNGDWGIQAKAQSRKMNIFIFKMFRHFRGLSWFTY